MKRQTSFLWNFTPATIAVSGNVSDELFIFLGGPKASLNLLLVTARVVTHLNSLTSFVATYVVFFCSCLLLLFCFLSGLLLPRSNAVINLYAIV